MINQTAVQQALKSVFPQFNDKHKLIDYFVSFDFPQKQMKMVSWWQKVIEFLIQNQQKTYITYQQLVNYVSFYNLKPTPLKSIIDFLSKKQVLVEESQIENKIKHEQTQMEAQNNKSWFGNIVSYVIKGSPKEENIFKFTAGEKIFSKKIKEIKKQQIKKEFHCIFHEHCKSIDQFKLIKLIEQRVKLDHDSIKQLLKELSLQNTIKISTQRQRPFVLFSTNYNDLKSSEWFQVESMKHCLRQQIQKFDFYMNREEQKIYKLREKAREQIKNQNQKSARVTAAEILSGQRKIVNISTRKTVLQNQLTQLQFNEMNKSTILLLQQSHQIYQQTMIDPSRLDDVIQKSMEMEQLNRQTNQKIQTLVNKEQLEDEVSNMMQELKREVQKNKHVEAQQIKVEINFKPQMQQGQPMDIESETKQVYMN